MNDIRTRNKTALLSFAASKVVNGKNLRQRHKKSNQKKETQLPSVDTFAAIENEEPTASQNIAANFRKIAAVDALDAHRD